MITRALLSALDKAQSPRMIRAISRGLEFTTGFSVKEIIGSFSTTDSEAIRKYRATYPGIAGALGSYSSHSGVNVTQDRALESSAVYACVKIISEDLGSMPFHLYRQDGKEVNRATKHPLYQALHDAANPEMGAGEWVEMMTAHAALGCDGFSRIVRNDRGEVIALWPYMPSQVRVIAKPRQPMLYEVQEDGSKWQTIPREEMFHLRGFTLNGTRGDDVLMRARHVLGLTLATQEYAGRFFSNDAGAGIYLESPVGAPGLGPEELQVIKDSWKKHHQSLAMAHEPAILQEGMTVKRLEPDHQKLQMIEQRKFQVIEVCRLFRMSPHKLADLDRMTFSNVEQMALDHTTTTLGPWRNRWKQSVYRCLLSPEERLSYFAEHNVESLLRGDFKTQTEGFRALLEKGVYSINEVRAWFNLNPVEGGDEHRVQVNVQAVADIAKEATAQAA